MRVAAFRMNVQVCAETTNGQDLASRIQLLVDELNNVTGVFRTDTLLNVLKEHPGSSKFAAIRIQEILTSFIRRLKLRMSEFLQTDNITIKKLNESIHKQSLIIEEYKRCLQIRSEKLKSFKTAEKTLNGIKNELTIDIVSNTHIISVIRDMVLKCKQCDDLKDELKVKDQELSDLKKQLEEKSTCFDSRLQNLQREKELSLISVVEAKKSLGNSYELLKDLERDKINLLKKVEELEQVNKKQATNMNSLKQNIKAKGVEHSKKLKTYKCQANKAERETLRLQTKLQTLAEMSGAKENKTNAIISDLRERLKEQKSQQNKNRISLKNVIDCCNASRSEITSNSVNDIKGILDFIRSTTKNIEILKEQKKLITQKTNETIERMRTQNQELVVHMKQENTDQQKTVLMNKQTIIMSFRRILFKIKTLKLNISNFSVSGALHPKFKDIISTFMNEHQKLRQTINISKQIIVDKRLLASQQLHHQLVDLRKEVDSSKEKAAHLNEANYNLKEQLSKLMISEKAKTKTLLAIRERCCAINGPFIDGIPFNPNELAPSINNLIHRFETMQENLSANSDKQKKHIDVLLGENETLTADYERAKEEVQKLHETNMHLQLEIGELKSQNLELIDVKQHMQQKIDQIPRKVRTAPTKIHKSMKSIASLNSYCAASPTIERINISPPPRNTALQKLKKLVEKNRLSLAAP